MFAVVLFKNFKFLKIRAFLEKFCFPGGKYLNLLCPLSKGLCKYRPPLKG
jgi:hypothetical protein